jgi:putative secretion ATPase (PEP-CTERM system associated)
MYQTLYKFSGRPFQLNPDPSFYFASKGHSRAFAYLKYGVYQGEGFIVLTGEIGAGKTTMALTLLNELDSERIVAAQLISTHLDADDLVLAVAAAFGLPVKDLSKAEMLAQFESFLTSLAAENRRALLIVDEAHNLTLRAMEELRMLSNFQRGSRALLQSFLVGQPELREILRRPTLTQLRQRIIASYHLGPMNREETQAYVLHRLERVAWTGDPQFEEEIFDRLYEVTGGLPRMINAMCNRLLLSACLAEKHVIGVAEFAEAIDEIRNEIGFDSPPAMSGDSPQAAPFEPLQAAPFSEAARAALRETPGVVRPFMSSAMAARLDRIDKGVNTAVELLQQLSNSEGNGRVISGLGSKPRSRFGVRAPGSS